MTAADTVLRMRRPIPPSTRTTPRHVDPSYVRDLALSDAKERCEDVACLLPPAGPLMTPQGVAELLQAYRRLGTALDRLSEAQGRVWCRELGEVCR